MHLVLRVVVMRQSEFLCDVKNWSNLSKSPPRHDLHFKQQKKQPVHCQVMRETLNIIWREIARTPPITSKFIQTRSESIHRATSDVKTCFAVKTKSCWSCSWKRKLHYLESINEMFGCYVCPSVHLHFYGSGTLTPSPLLSVKKPRESIWCPLLLRKWSQMKKSSPPNMSQIDHQNLII